MNKRIGFIGLGNMGSPIAQRLLDAGNDMMVYDARKEVVAAWNPDRCQGAASVSEIGDNCDYVFLCLPSPAILEKVVLGEGGLVTGKRVKKIIDLSTTGLEGSKKVAEGLAGSDKILIDSPVSGGLAGARAGTLALMLACSEEDLEELRSLYAPLGKIFHIGTEPGMGQIMKVLNNLLTSAALALSSEVVVAGVKAGLDADTIIDVLNVSSGRNSATVDKFPRSILPRTFDFGFSNQLMVKDVSLFTDLSDYLGLKLPIAAAVHTAWDRAVKEIGPDTDFTSIIRIHEREAGLEVKGKKAG